MVTVMVRFRPGVGAGVGVRGILCIRLGSRLGSASGLVSGRFACRILITTRGGVRVCNTSTPFFVCTLVPSFQKAGLRRGADRGSWVIIIDQSYRRGRDWDRNSGWEWGWGQAQLCTIHRGAVWEVRGQWPSEWPESSRPRSAAPCYRQDCCGGCCHSQSGSPTVCGER